MFEVLLPKPPRNHQDSPLWQIFVILLFFHDSLFILYDWFMRRKVVLLNTSSTSLSLIFSPPIKLIKTAGSRRQLFLLTWTMRLDLYVFVCYVCQAIRLSIPIDVSSCYFDWHRRRVFVWHFPWRSESIN